MHHINSSSNVPQNLESVLRNPLKMERIRNSVAAQLDDVERKKKEKKAAKQLKKTMKKEKEREKGKKRARSSSSSRSASPDRSNQRLNRVPETAMRAQTAIDKYDSRDNNAHLHSRAPHSRSSDRGLNNNHCSARNEDQHNRRHSRSRDGERGRNGGRDRIAARDDDQHTRRRSSRSRDRRDYSGRDSERDENAHTSRRRDGDHGARRRDDHRSDRRHSRSRDRGVTSNHGSARDDDKHNRRRSRSRDRERGRNGGRDPVEDQHNSRRRSSSVDINSRDGIKDSPHPSHSAVKIVSVDLKLGEVREKPADEAQNKKYGLLVKGNGGNSIAHKDGVGPSLALLAKKADEDKREKESRNRPRENVKKLTAEEREERIAQMESDASVSNSNRIERVNRSQAAVVHADERPLNEEATFINSMRTEVYVTDGTTMRERLEQNRHYIQKGSDLDSTGFIKK